MAQTSTYGTERPHPRREQAFVRRARFRGLSYHAILLAICAVFCLPFVIMALTALKTPQDIFSVPPSLLPKEWTLENFGAATTSMPLVRYLGNTAMLVVLNIVGILFSCPLVAYSLAKLRWTGRDPLFIVVLATMMLPPQVTMIPLYKLWNDVGAVGTFWPLLLPPFFGSAFYIFLLRQFFLGIPDELLEAARIDGASEFRIYWQIVLPLAKPALATVAVFQFMATWTDFMLPLLYLNDPDKYTLSIGLYSFFGEHGVEWGPLMGACLLFTLPAIGIFLVAQRYFIQGISVSGLK